MDSPEHIAEKGAVLEAVLEKAWTGLLKLVSNSYVCFLAAPHMSLPNRGSLWTSMPWSQLSATKEEYLHVSFMYRFQCGWMIVRDVNGCSLDSLNLHRYT